MFDISSKLKTISERSGIPLHKLEERYLAYKKEEEEKCKDEKEKPMFLDTKAYYRLLAEVSKEVEAITTSKAVMYQGYIIGDTGIKNLAEFMRNKALKMYNDPTTREDAILLGLTDEKGTVLDPRKGVKGPRPLPEKILLRTLYTVIIDTKTKIPRLAILELTNKTVNVEPKLFVPCRFRANPSKTKTDYIRLRSSKYTKFEEIDMDVNIIETLKQSLEIIPLRRLETWYHEHKSNRFAIVGIEGIVRDLNLEPNIFTGSRRMDILETEEDLLEPLRCYVPSHLSINFGEYSKVIVIGRPSLRIREEEERLSFNVYGLYVYPEYRVEYEAREVTEEEVGDLWITKE